MTDSQGVIGQTVEDGLPVLYRYIDETPAEQKRSALPWLTIISWPYDKTVRNGMPPEDVNTRMVDLEERLSTGVEAAGFCEHAVSKTGNGLKELIYYINDRDTFSERLNVALEGQPRYPIEITFYHDPEWKEFEITRAMFEGDGT